MSDADLLDLERRAASGTVEDRIHYARALERVGQATDAIEALLPEKRDDGARREIFRLLRCEDAHVRSRSLPWCAGESSCRSSTTTRRPK